MSGFAVLDYDYNSDSSVDMDEGNCESEIDVTPMNSLNGEQYLSRLVKWI